METKPKDEDENYDLRKKSSDEIFCYSCGSPVKKNALVCPRCGVSFTWFPHRKNIKKEKETAILLALFTSFFVWLYLYEKSSIKFWVGLPITLLSLILTKFTFDANVSYWYLALTPALIIWLFALADVSKRDKKYFESFEE